MRGHDGGPPVLKARGLGFSYTGGEPVFEGLDLDIRQGETIVLTGPSGCGKSTLCAILAGVIPRNIRGELRGSVYLDGRDMSTMTLAELARTVGMVRQEPESQLFSPTLEDELAFGPENLCLPPGEIRARVDEALSLTGLEKYRGSAPHTLSGGQKQIAALAAVLALRPKILILDEIFCHLDADSSANVCSLIQKLNVRGTAVLIAEHKIPGRTWFRSTVDIRTIQNSPRKI